MIKLKSMMVLPFRASIKPFELTCKIPGDTFDTNLKLSYKDNILFPPSNVKICTNLCSIITVVTFFKPSKKQPINYKRPTIIHEGWMYLINEYILPKVNWFLYIIKKNHPNPSVTGVLRHIGEIDLVVYNLKCEGTNIVRGTSTFMSSQGVQIEITDTDISLNIFNEWRILTRSVDLINHGYYIEAFLVAFALLDDKIQEFLSERFPNITKKEAKKLLRKIERQRLVVFLDSLMKIVTKSSTFDAISNLQKDIEWFNDKRNTIMHSGGGCTRQDCKRAMNITLAVLKFLNSQGAKYQLPSEFRYWTLDSTP